MNIQIKYLLRELKPMNQPQVAEGMEEVRSEQTVFNGEHMIGFKVSAELR